MAFIEINQDFLSDLLVKEVDPSAGYARRVVTVTTTADMPQGTLVFRTIASGALDQDAPFAPVTDATAQLVATNELAVVFGDKWKAQSITEGAATGNVKAVAFVRGEVQLKDHLILSVNEIERDSAEHKAAKALLEKQGIILLETISA